MEHRDLSWAELVRTRRSVTDYTGEVVSRDLVRAIVEEATLAPSAFNSQPWRFVVVQDEAIDGLTDVLGGNHAKVRAAGTLVAVFADLADVTGDGDRAGYYDSRTGRSPVEYGVRNASLAAMALMYAAWSHGVGTRPMIGFDADGLAEQLDVPASWHPVMVLALGWPEDDAPGPGSRRDVDEVLRFA